MTRTVTSLTLRRKLAVSTALGATLAIVAAPARAQLSTPADASVVRGATVSGAVTGGTPPVTTPLVVDVTANNAVINWSKFDVPSGFTAQFTNSSGATVAAVLNRVAVGRPASDLGGTITGSGVEVWVSNPNGILFGPGTNINTGGFVATTRAISDNDFGADPLTGLVADRDYNLTTAVGGSVTAGITSSGAGAQIRTNGGLLALIAPVIAVNGTFNAGTGADAQAAFVVAEDLSFTADAGSPLSFTINRGTTVTTASTLAGSVAGNRVWAIVSAQSGINALLGVSAGVTAATVTGNGVVVLGGDANPDATGVTFTATGAIPPASLLADNNGTSNVTVANITNTGGTVALGATGTLGGTGAITAATLSAAAGGAVTLTGTNQLAAVSRLTSDSGAASLNNGVALTINGAGASAAGLTVTNTGALTVAAAADAGTGALQLTGDGLAATAALSGGDVILNARIGTLDVGAGLITATGSYQARGATFANDALAPGFTGGATHDFTIVDTAGGLSLGAITAPDTLAISTLAGGQLTTTALLKSNNAAVNLTGAGGIRLGADVESASGQTHTGAVTLTADVTLSATDAAAPIRFTGTVNGAHALTVSTPGPTSFDGAVGGGAALTALDVTGGAAALGADVDAAAQSYAGQVQLGADAVLTGTTGNLAGGVAGGGHALTLDFSGAATIGTGVSGVTTLVTDSGAASGTTTLNGTIATTAGQTYNDAVRLGSDVSVTSSGAGAAGDLTFNGTVNSTGAARALTVGTAGQVAFNGAVGGTAALASIDTDGVTGGTALNADVTTIGAQRYRGVTTGAAGAAVTLTANAGGDVSFAGTTSGAKPLVVNTAGTTTFSGPVTALAALTTDAGGTTVLGGGTIGTTGAQSYGDAVSLTADTTIAATAVTLTAGLTGAGHDLAFNVSGAQTLNGTITGVRNLSTDAAGSLVLTGAITTSGTQTYNDPVALSAGSATLTSTGTGAAGAITFANTLVGPGGLTVVTPGALSFDGLVGAGTALTTIDATGAGGVRLRAAGVTTTGAQRYGPTLVNGVGDVTLSAGGNVAFAGLGGPRGLTVNTAGTTTIQGNNGAALAFLTTDAGGTALLSGTINTTGDQSYNDAVTLAGNTVLAGTRALFNAGLTGAGFDITLNATGAQTLGSGVTGVRNLLSDAAGTLTLTGNVTTTGTQTYLDATTLSANVVLDAGANLVRFGDTLVSDAGGRSLQTLSPTEFDGDVGGAGGTTRLASLQTGSATTLGGAGTRTIRTVGAQSYGDTLALGRAGVLVGTTATFVGGVNGTGARNALTLTFTDPTTLGANPFSNVGNLLVNGVAPLTLNGNLTTFGGQTYVSTLVLGAPVVLTSTNAGAISLAAVTGSGQALTVATGGATSFTVAPGGLAGLTTDAGGTTTITGGITTTGAQLYGDTVLLASDATFVSTAGGTINFAGALSGGGRALTVTTGALTTFGGAVSGLASLASTGAGAVRLTGGGVTTTGDQSYTGQLQLGANTVLTGVNGTFSGGVAGGGFDLTLDFSGPTAITAGTFAGIGNLTTGGGGTTSLTGTINTAGGQTYNDAVVLTGATTLQSGGGTGTGTIRFAGTVDGGQALRVTTAGQTRFDAAVGTTPLAALTVDGTGAILIGGGSIRTTGAQAYTGPVTLSADTVLATGGGDLTFAGTVDGARVLSVRTSLTGVPVTGNVAFGGGTALTGLAIRANAASATGGNRVGTLAALVNTGGLVWSDAGALTLGTVDGLAGLTTGSGAATVTAGGLLTLAANVASGAAALTGTGVTQAAGTTVNAGAGMVLIDGNDGALTLAGTLLTTNGGAGAVRLIDATDAQLGTIQTGAGGTLTLGAVAGDSLSGNVGQLAGGAITAGVVAGSVGGALTLTNANAIGSLGALNAGSLSLRTTAALTVAGPVSTGTGALTLRLDSGALTLAGDLTGGAVTFTIAGGIGQTAGLLTAATLTGSAGGAVSLGRANRVTTLDAFTTIGAGSGFQLTNAQALSVTADVTAAGALGIDATALDFTGRTLSAGGNAALTAAGAIAGGTVSAGGNITGTGQTIAIDSAAAGAAPSGTLILTATDGLTLNNGTAGQAITLASTNGPLAVSGALIAGAAGNLGSVTAITVTSGGSATVAGATSHHGGLTVTGGSVALTSGIATNGALALTATAAGGALTLGTGVAGTTATLDSQGALGVTDALTSGGNATLTALGTATVRAVTSTGGAVLVRGAGVALGSDPALVAASSQTALTVQATAGDVALTNAAAGGDAGITATGAIGFGAIGTAAAPIGGSATLTAGGAITGTSLIATGNAAATGGGLVQIATLTGAAASAQGSGVDVTAAAATGALLLKAAAGTVRLGTGTAGGTADLIATGDVTVTGGVTATGAVTVNSGGTATLAAVQSRTGQIGITGASVGVGTAADAKTALALTATAGDVTVGTGTAGSDATVKASGAVAAGTLAAGGALTVTAGSGLTLGTGTAGTTATLTAAGPLAITGKLTSGGNATVSTSGTATIATLISTGGGVAVTGGSASVTTAKAATTLDLTGATGALTLGTGTAGGAATLKSAGTLATTSLTAGPVTATATGAATLGQTTAGGAVAVTAAGIAAGATTAGGALTMTSTGDLSVASAQAAADATFDTSGTATLGQVVAGTSSTITVRALDAAINGTQRAGAVTFVNRTPTTTAFKLGDGTSAGGFALSQAEVNNVEAAQLTFDGGAGSAEIGALAFDGDAGRTRVDLLATGRIDVTGAVSGGGSGRTFRLGGAAGDGAERADTIRVAATGAAGGRLLFETADLELRGTRIGVGQAAGFLDPIGLSPGGTPQSAGAVAAAFVGNPNSSLYNATFGGAPYSAPTLLSARSLTVRFGDYALFQNSAAPGLNAGTVLGSAATPVSPALVLQGPGSGTNAFAIFGTINGITGTPAAVLGSTTIAVSGVDLANTRVNGCIAGSGAGCLTAVVSQPLLNVFDASRLNVFKAADDLALPFDPLIGTNNEALFSGFGLIDSPVTGTGCGDDPGSPACRQQQRGQEQ